LNSTIKDEGRAAFCDQKVAKNFIRLGRAGSSARAPVKQKFWRRFLKKTATPLSFIAVARAPPPTLAATRSVACSWLASSYRLVLR
jgi:hypothetical protein